jgi:SAM-dependent methyltransferase
MVKEAIKYTAGFVCAKLLPRKADDIRSAFTIPEYWNPSLAERATHRLIRFYTGCQAQAQEISNPGRLETLHKSFWCEVEQYFSVANNRVADIYIPAYQDIGSGDGQWLNYLSQQWPFIQQFTGIDLSKSQVETNAQIYPHLTFIRADLVAWSQENITSNTLYHTNGGVLEYVCEDSVRELIKNLKDQAKNSMVLLIEPLHGDYDLNQDRRSKIIGYEYSYTHNYVHLLETAGFKVIHYEERQVMHHRMLIVLADNAG